jgi:hypothetical protein
MRFPHVIWCFSNLKGFHEIFLWDLWYWDRYEMSLCDFVVACCIIFPCDFLMIYTYIFFEPFAVPFSYEICFWNSICFLLHNFLVRCHEISLWGFMLLGRYAISLWHCFAFCWIIDDETLCFLTSNVFENDWTWPEHAVVIHGGSLGGLGKNVLPFFFSCALTVNELSLLFLRQCFIRLQYSTETSVCGMSLKLRICRTVSQYI